MADADLDDFFAKKDRKKAKGKKFTTTEEIAKKLEEKKIEKPKPKEKPVNPEGGDEIQQVEEEEEEWKEFEEEKKDYTGLKIGNLNVVEKVDKNYDDERNAGETGSDGESGDGDGKHSGPWKKADAPSQAAEPEPQPPRPQPVAAPAPAAGTGSSSYRPPHVRNPPPSYDRERPIGRPRGKNIAPDINSEEYFPTLNSKQPANEATGAWGRKKRDEGTFEEVRNRGGTYRTYSTPETQSQAPKLSLGNKYGALPQDQS
ncbi:hypothetical protein TSAR_012406 [Trichomalopsis sarcophagae]|uniref:Protein CDV3 homolog n=1 Tax=Trichomalopsis sarcophagae TaxID=543379 RepID=A0A232F5V1_9HYME|nr:hypothetical protein TSAR_012406 [Trichomalopsis sarcophagae]